MLDQVPEDEMATPVSQAPSGQVSCREGLGLAIEEPVDGVH